MRANPGGEIDPAEVIGRDDLIGRLWRVLERQSLVLTAERRLGKTCIIKKMNVEAPGPYLTLYRDLERVHTTREFAELVLHDVHTYLSKLGKALHRARQFLERLGGTALPGGIKLPQGVAIDWKELLTTTIEDLVERQEQAVILFWDEVPLMLGNIVKRQGDTAAMEVLDLVRSLRQMHAGLRMVFTGSIGLHNAILSLRRHGYANAPINDMQIEDVPPLAPVDAKRLALLLLEGEDIKSDDRNATASAVAEGVDGIPYYIHHVVDQMARIGGPANTDSVQQIIHARLTDPQDQWHLRHYYDRIKDYYTEPERPFVLGLLDVVAGSDTSLSFEDVFNRLKASVVTEDRETTLDILTRLQLDHYLVQESEGMYRFRFPLIRRWWKLHRGLST